MTYNHFKIVSVIFRDRDFLKNVCILSSQLLGAVDNSWGKQWTNQKPYKGKQNESPTHSWEFRRLRTYLKIMCMPRAMCMLSRPQGLTFD